MALFVKGRNDQGVQETFLWTKKSSVGIKRRKGLKHLQSKLAPSWLCYNSEFLQVKGDLSEEDKMLPGLNRQQRLINLCWISSRFPHIYACTESGDFSHSCSPSSSCPRICQMLYNFPRERKILVMAPFW